MVSSSGRDVAKTALAGASVELKRLDVPRSVIVQENPRTVVNEPKNGSKWVNSESANLSSEVQPVSHGIVTEVKQCHGLSLGHLQGSVRPVLVSIRRNRPRFQFSSRLKGSLDASRRQLA